MAEIHKEIIKKIVDKEKELIGEVAFMHVKKLEFMDIDESGNISFSEEIEREHLEKVIDTYRKVLKGGAVAAAREALKEYDPSELVSVDLPEEILPRDVKVKKFTSSF